MADNTNENDIRNVVERWAKAVRDGDMEGILAHHTDDIVMFDVPIAQARGIDAYKETWDLFFKYSSGGDGAFDILELEITASDTVGFSHSLIKIFDNRVRLTMGFRKEGGQWLISHEHHSYPSASEDSEEAE
jgi:ketosteroid isomerase-like protein